MSSRDTIFSKIRTALGEVKDKAAYPDYDPAVLHAKPKLEGTPREAVPRATLHRLLLAFADAMQRSDFRGLHALLSDDAELIGDGGGKVGSFSSLIGGKRLAQLFYAGKRRFRDALRIEVLQVNGQWALLRFVDEKLESVQSYETDGTRFTRILVQRNPDKLARIAALTERR